MARHAQVVKLEKQRRLVERFATKRAMLVIAIRTASSVETRTLAEIKLAALPRDSAPTRLRNRCRSTGRSRGYLRKFELCRNELRRLALQGDIPGVRKSSW